LDLIGEMVSMGGGSPVAAVARSARQILIDWANKQDGWVRALTAEVLATRRELASPALERVRTLYLAEKQLSDDPIPLVPPLADDGSQEIAAEALRLLSIKDCRAVNALADSQEINFNARMTVLFGENASGKTGYVRVLKRLAGVRSAEEVLPDIHRPSLPAEPQAAIRYALGTVENDFEWHNDVGVPPFTRISIFDSRAVELHLEQDVTYVYTPADLALFRYVHSGLQSVRQLLDAEIAANQPKQNPFLTAFTRGTSIYAKIESLGAGTSAKELDALGTVSAAERAELDARRLTVEALTSKSAEAQTELLRTRRAILQNLIILAEAFTTFQWQVHADAVLSNQQARARQAAAATSVFSSGTLPEELQVPWQAFIEAGGRYLQAAGYSEYPRPDASCIYCNQALSAAAVTLLARYREYASGAATAASKTAVSHLAALASPLTNPAVDASVQTLVAILEGADAGIAEPPWMSDGRILLRGGRAVIDQVAASHTAHSQEQFALATALLPQLRAAQIETDLALKTLEADEQEKTRLLREEQTAVAALEARLTLERLLPEVQVYVERATWSYRLKTLLTRFQGLLKSLTDTMKVASEQVLNRDFERLFYEECRLLRAPNVTLDFPGRQGKAARRKTVAADHALSEILSEGEQKVIAIADFLAEARLRSGSAPIVFDDPVNSLDHRRLHEVVDRVVALSGDHQVVVLTHNIWFAAELLSRFDNRPRDCDYLQVVEANGRKGVVTRASHPRLDTPAKITGRLNGAIQEIKASPLNEQPAKVDAAYDHIRTWCETVVEKDLLAGVTERFHANVAMTSLERIKSDRLTAAIDVILPIWRKACRYIPGHSQPLETLGVRPGLDELRTDWDALQMALKAYLSG
jgi:recombinational DNA repair ATPase RecF